MAKKDRFIEVLSHLLKPGNQVLWKWNRKQWGGGIGEQWEGVGRSRKDWGGVGRSEKEWGGLERRGKDLGGVGRIERCGKNREEWEE